VTGRPSRPRDPGGPRRPRATGGASRPSGPRLTGRPSRPRVPGRPSGPRVTSRAGRTGRPSGSGRPCRSRGTRGTGRAYTTAAGYVGTARRETIVSDGGVRHGRYSDDWEGSGDDGSAGSFASFAKASSIFAEKYWTAIPTNGRRRGVAFSANAAIPSRRA